MNIGAVVLSAICLLTFLVRPANALSTKKRLLSPTVAAALEKKKRELQINAVDDDGKRLTLIQEGFDRIPVALFWIHPNDSAKYAILEHPAGKRVLTLGDGITETKHDIADWVSLPPGSLLFRSQQPEDSDRPFRLVSEDNPLVAQPYNIAHPTKVGSGILLDTIDGDMLVPMSNPYETTAVFKKKELESIEGAFLLEHRNGYTLAMEEDVAIRSPRFTDPPIAFSGGWLGKAGGGDPLLLVGKPDFQRIMAIQRIDDRGDYWNILVDGGYRDMSKADYKRVSPELEDGQPWHPNILGRLRHDLGRIIIQKADPGNYSRRFRMPPGGKIPEYGDYFLVDRYESGKYDKWVEEVLANPSYSREERDQEIGRGEHFRKERDKDPVSGWHFFIDKANPSSCSPEFLGEPKRTVGGYSYFVQTRQGDQSRWLFLDKKRPTITSIEVFTPDPESVEGAWRVPEVRGTQKFFRLIQKNDIQVSTDLLQGTLEDLGESWQAADIDGMLRIIFKSDLKIISRPLAHVADYGASVIGLSPRHESGSPGKASAGDGFWRLVRKDNPTVESIPFRGVLEENKRSLLRLSRGRKSSSTPPERILVEDMKGNAVWISTTTLQVEEDGGRGH